MKFKTKYYSFFYIFLVSVQILWYGLLFRYMFSLPNFGNTDFIIFYTAGKIAQEDYASIYNLDLQRDIQHQIVGDRWVAGGVLPFNHPPYLVPILKHIVSTNFTGSFIRWELVLIAFILISQVCIYLLMRSQGLDSKTAILCAASYALFYPIIASLLKGQASSFLVLGSVIWVYALLNRNEKLAGLSLALTTVKPHIALMLAIPFIFKNRKIFLWFCIGCFILIISSYVLVGPQGIKDFYQLTLLTAEGSGYGINQSSMYNVLGFLLRMFPQIEINMIKTLAWMLYFLTIIILCYLWNVSKQIDIRMIGTAVILAVLTAPHLHFHDLALLYIPMLCIVLLKAQYGKENIFNTGIFLALSSILLILFSGSSLRYLSVYVLAGILVFLLWRRIFQKLPEQEQRNPYQVVDN